MKANLYIVGGGGHCTSCIDVVEQEGRYSIKGIIDTPDKLGKTLLGYSYSATDEDLPNLCRTGGDFLIGVGQIMSSQTRFVLFNKLKSLGGQFARIISPFSVVSPHARLGEGCIVMHGAVVNAGAVIGKNCIINTGAIIEHHSHIGSHFHISTNAVLNGDTRVADHCFIGSSAMVIQGVEIGEQTVVGAGNSVFKDLPPHTILKG